MQKLGVARKFGKDFSSFIQDLKNHSIEMYEIGFAFGVPENYDSSIFNDAKEKGVDISAHLPFFITWTSEEIEKKSINYIKNGINFSKEFDTIAVFHPGYYGDNGFSSMKDKIINGIDSASESSIISEKKGPFLGIETTGKQYEIGTVDEIIEIIQGLSNSIAIPVVDWAHLYARSNGLFPRTKEDFQLLLNRLENELDLTKFYFHGSGIQYKNSNEYKHLSVKTCVPPLPYLLDELKDSGYDYTLIVESPDAINDVKWLKEVNENPKKWCDDIKNKFPLKEVKKQSSLFGFVQ